MVFNLAKLSLLLTTVQCNCMELHFDHKIVEKFKNWIDTFRIQFKDDQHVIHTFENWLSNDEFIGQINSQNLQYSLGHNSYSGMSSKEFSELMGFKNNKKVFSSRINNSTSNTHNIIKNSFNNLVDNIDWRNYNVVSNIRDQQQCGSCWAFSGTSSLESAIAIKTGELYDLSEQASVSCSLIRNGYHNMGCNGGMYDEMWKYVSDNGGLCLESSYPYSSGTGDSGTCLTECNVITSSNVVDHVVVKSFSDNAMMEALNIGPVSIALQADTRTFQLYDSGVYSDFEGCGGSKPELDHAVVLVGYGTLDGQDYYVMRNSWGTSWGNQDDLINNGYMLMARGIEYGRSGLCGLLSEPMYPVV